MQLALHMPGESQKYMLGEAAPRGTAGDLQVLDSQSLTPQRTSRVIATSQGAQLREKDSGKICYSDCLCASCAEQLVDGGLKKDHWRFSAWLYCTAKTHGENWSVPLCHVRGRTIFLQAAGFAAKVALTFAETVLQGKGTEERVPATIFVCGALRRSQAGPG